jgi:hypothetical protein
MGRRSRDVRERRGVPTVVTPLLPIGQIGGTQVVRTDAPDFDYIKVGVTPDLVDECFVIDLNGPGPYRKAQLRLHTTEVLDLQKKLSNAITDWMGLSVARVIELQGEAKTHGK